MKEGNMRAFTIYFDRRYGRAMPKSLPKTDALQRFEVEVIGGQGDNVFKRIVESIRFENDAGETWFIIVRDQSNTEILRKTEFDPLEMGSKTHH